MLVPDAIFAKKLLKHHPVKLRPSRSGYTPYIAEKLDLVHLKKFKKIGERMPAMADGVKLHELNLSRIGFILQCSPTRGSVLSRLANPGFVEI